MYELFGNIFGEYSISLLLMFILLLIFNLFSIILVQGIRKKLKLFLLSISLIIISIPFLIGFVSYSKKNVVKTLDCNQYQNFKGLDFDENITILHTVSQSKYGYGFTETFKIVKDCNSTK